MWYAYEKHICEKCGEEFQYSKDTMTFVRGTKCPHCGQEFKFEGTEIKVKENI
jgi:DNA-directed RNA polymerase subunit RPC12/RpoP